MFIHLFRWSDLHDLSEVHHRNAVRDMPNHGEVVGDEHVRHAESLLKVVEKVDELRKFCVDETLIDNLLEKESLLKIDDTFTMPLRAFKARQTVEGVEIEMVRGVPAMVFEGAFGPKIPKLGRNIYKRVGKKRFPIQKLRDLQVSKIEGVKDAFDRGAAQAQAILNRKLKEAKQDANQILGKDKYATA